MIVKREELYFEPRVVNFYGGIRWYGGTYSDEKVMMHTEETVYIRDDGNYLYIYSMNNDGRVVDDEHIKATFTLITKLPTHDKNYRYGKKVRYAE